LAVLICDTSALIALHQVGLLYILPELSPTVVLPAAVAQELAAGQSQGYDVPDIAGLNWLRIRTPTTRPSLLDAKLLGVGESDVLWVALETPGGVAVLDEVPARRVAGQLGIPFTGTLGLLVDAKNLGLFPAVGPLLIELDRHDFHMSPRIRETILKAAGETPL
jgi:predicted nucleic acid-binding protein